MSDTITLELSIPSDNDGYVLLQCSHCGSLFKLKAESIDDDSILFIYCPSCGLISDNYLSDDAIDLAMAKTRNYALSLIQESFKDLERKTKGKNFRFHKSSSIDKVEEKPIITRVDMLTIANFACCNRTAKIHPLIKFSCGYCPYCGVIDFDIK